jgi:aquaporin Z
MIHKSLSEFIGTFFLVLIIQLTVSMGAVEASAAISFGLIGMIYMGGHLFKAQYNPAVSLAFWMRKTFTAKEVGWAVGAQLLGGFAGALAGGYLSGSTIAVAPGEASTLPQFLLAEFLFTFALVQVILNVAITNPGNGFYGIAIGFIVFAGIVAVGPISGAAFNPAVAICLNLVNGTPEHIPVYLLSTFAGGAFAAVVFGWMNPKESG